MHIERNITSLKKVTHLVKANGERHYCTSAAHVCQTLQGLGVAITPAVVYRNCSNDQRRAHKRTIRDALPYGIEISRYVEGEA